MKETLYSFKVDKQFRLTLSTFARELYDFEDKVYLKLQVIESEKYLQISGKKLDFYHAIAKIDEKGRFIIPKEARVKFKLEVGDMMDSFECECDSNFRTLFLKKITKERKDEL